MNRASFLLLSIVIACATAIRLRAADGAAAPLPAGVRAVWDLDSAHREATPTRERVCLNGLWRWQPAIPGASAVPEGEWGFRLTM